MIFDVIYLTVRHMEERKIEDKCVLIKRAKGSYR